MYCHFHCATKRLLPWKRYEKVVAKAGPFLGLIVVIFLIAFIYARLQGPVEAEPLAEQAGELLAAEDQAPKEISKVTK